LIRASHFFFIKVHTPPHIHPLSLHDALPICYARAGHCLSVCAGTSGPGATNLLTGVACAFADGIPLLVVTGQAARHALGKGAARSEEHTSELQSRENLVCRLLLEKKKTSKNV